MGHFWVASGPLYLDKAYPIEKAIVLKRFADYPDSSTKWMFLLDK
jgi:peptide/nickel transport system substrate-binding protein